MVDVVEVKRKHWVGLDADKAEIAGANGDTYYATDKTKHYYWAGTWKTGLGYEFVERLVAAADKGVGDFVTDGTWKVDGLDLSAIVPAGAIAVVLRIDVTDDAASSTFTIRRDAVNGLNGVAISTQVANIQTTRPSVVVSIDTDRLLDYTGTNLVFAQIDVAVIGWYI